MVQRLHWGGWSGVTFIEAPSWEYVLLVKAAARIFGLLNHVRWNRGQNERITTRDPVHHGPKKR